MLKQSPRTSAAKRSAHGTISAVFVLTLLLALLPGTRAYAHTVYTNPETGYIVLVEDDADLLTDEQESLLAERMRKITNWGNVAFKSIDRNSTTAASYAESYYRERFGQESGTVFLIDMDNRQLRLKNDGRISRTITNGNSDTIMDNVYRRASRGDYYGCAAEVYKEVAALMSGNPIPLPMKYISNALLALILALLINYGIMRHMSKNHAPGQKERLLGMNHHYALTNARADYINTTTRYDPQSSDSGSDSSGGGGSSGGGSSGGGSSGSGGGHSF